MSAGFYGPTEYQIWRMCKVCLGVKLCWALRPSPYKFSILVCLDGSTVHFMSRTLLAKFFTLVHLALIACSSHRAQPNIRQTDSSPVDLDAGKCVSEQSPTAVDGGLPSWSVGFFHAVLPNVANAVNLRLGPLSDFEWALTGCDFSAGQVGSATFTADEVLLQPSDAHSTMEWPDNDSISTVPSVQITIRPGGGVISRDQRETIEWLPGLQCGCVDFHPCNCSDAFFPNRIP